MNDSAFALRICIAAILVYGAWTTVAGGEETSNDALAHCLEPFHVRDCTGPAAGKTLCYYCRYGQRPVVCVFARHLDEQTEELIARIDELVGEHREQRWAAFVVLLREDTQANERLLKQLAARHEIRHTPLTIYRDAPEKLHQNLRISGDAHVTVRWWSRSVVAHEHVVDERPDAQKISQITSDLANWSSR